MNTLLLNAQFTTVRQLATHSPVRSTIVLEKYNDRQSAFGGFW
jgi:hypothetical protein